MSDIIDRIDELVDAQLEQEPSGYDHDVNQEKCWHCGRDWHGLKITERIAQMYARRAYDEAYSVAEDDSPVLCEGSDFIGPMPCGSTSGLHSTNAEPPAPACVQFWDSEFNWLSTTPVSDWQWVTDGRRARFMALISTLPASPTAMLRMMITTREPRWQVWRIDRVTNYSDGRVAVRIINVQAEAVAIEQMMAGVMGE